MSLVFKILSRVEWAEAEEAGAFSGSEIDLRDGFIHLSAADQVEKTASLWFADRDDLVLVAIDATGLDDALKWEPSRGGALFPHLYGSLSMDRVSWATPFSSRSADELRSLIAGTK